MILEGLGEGRGFGQGMIYDHSSSSQEEYSSRGTRRSTKHNEDDLRDMKFNPLNFEGTLNPDVYLEWIQTLERFFEAKGYSNEKSSKISILKLKKYAFLWYENTKRERAREGKPRFNTWSKLKKAHEQEVSA